MKLEEMRQSSSDELVALANSYRRELFVLRYRVAGGDAKEALKMKSLRRDIARILTILNERKRQREENV